MVKVSPVETISTGNPASSIARLASTHCCIQRLPFLETGLVVRVASYGLVAHHAL